MYVPRIVDVEIQQLLRGLPALVLEGAKGVGKTETATRHAGTRWELDDPAQREAIAADPRIVAAGETPILIDEWQRLPMVWDVVRRAVDSQPSPGRFVLTGSAVPAESPTHSGAARLTQVRMRPMSSAERGLATPTVSLAALLTGERTPIEGRTDVGLDRYADEIVRGGFPGLGHLEGRAARAAYDGYIARIIERDFEELGHPVRAPGTLRRWLDAYAAATSTTASFETVRDAATGGQADKPSRSATQPYRDVLERLWIVEPVPAWVPTRNRISELAAAPKHQLADPALAATLHGIDAEALVRGHPAATWARPFNASLLGQLFESLVTLDMRVYAQAAESTVGHLRTKGGRHEVDLVVERRDQRVVAVEVKLARTVDDDDVRHLRWLATKLGDTLLDAVVITTGEVAYRRPDGIAVVPAALLGP